MQITTTPTFGAHPRGADLAFRVGVRRNSPYVPFPLRCNASGHPRGLGAGFLSLQAQYTGGQIGADGLGRESRTNRSFTPHITTGDTDSGDGQPRLTRIAVSRVEECQMGVKRKRVGAHAASWTYVRTARRSFNEQHTPDTLENLSDSETELSFNHSIGCTHS